jgi:CBS-domain-containing membrane protein
MQITKSLHPAGGGTVVVACQGIGTPVEKMSYDLLAPVTLTAVLISVFGFLNNLGRGKSYPTGDGPQIPKLKEMIAAGVSALLGMSLLSWVHWGLLGGSPSSMIIGTMGASAVLVWAAPQAPQAQPKNVIGGHIISAFIGVTFFMLMGPNLLWLEVPLANALSIVAMKATGTTHSAGGGTSLVALLTPAVHPLGYMLVLDVALTSVVIVFGGLVLNNAGAFLFGLDGRQYPKGFKCIPQPVENLTPRAGGL